MSFIHLFKNWVLSLFSKKIQIDSIQKRELLRKLLLSLIATVIFMMVVGAITRLTDSGLSIPEWPLINGTLMYPFTDADWNAVFDTYKKYPQYEILFKGMSVSEFKFIFFFEYFHRSITSLVSLFLFFIGLVIVLDKSLRNKYFKHFILIFILLIIQAFVGYYMVKSGLQPEMARVDHLMLLFHLSTAMIFLSIILWLYLRVNHEEKRIEYSKYHKSATILFGITFLQFMTGALVAGTKAGYHFSDWPLMNGHFIPDGLWAKHYSWFQNLTENIATIQFVHRMLAYTVVILIILKLKQILKELNSENIKKSVYIIYTVLTVQVLLGIFNLWYHVPVALGALHQLGGILLLLSLLRLVYQLKTKLE